MKKLKSKQVSLDTLSLKDAEALFSFAGHELIAKTVTWEAHQSVEDSRTYIERVLKRISSTPGNVFEAWGVREPGRDEIVGLVSLTELAQSRAQIGYVFHYHHWEKRVPVDALRLVLNHAFQTYAEFERVQARYFPTSTESIALLERLGMQFEGVNKAMLKVRGEPRDLTCFASTRNHWMNRFNLGDESSHGGDGLDHI